MKVLEEQDVIKMSSLSKIQRTFKFNDKSAKHKHDYAVRAIAEISSYSGTYRHLVNKCSYCNSFKCIPSEGSMSGFTNIVDNSLPTIRLHSSHKFDYFHDLELCDSELELVVPLYTVTPDALVSLEHLSYRQELLSILNRFGVLTESYLDEKIVDNYKFDEEIIRVYAPPSLVDSIISSYIELVAKFHSEFRHNFYVYGLNGFNHSFQVSDENIVIK